MSERDIPTNSLPFAPETRGQYNTADSVKGVNESSHGWGGWGGWRFLSQDARKDNGKQSVDSMTPSTFYTATPGYEVGFGTPGRINPGSAYGRVLQEHKLLEAKEIEINWSGRGQHVDFGINEIIPLETERTIGHSATALVESVRCRRIRLARKSIRCNRHAKPEDLVKEVAYLHKLRHPHIVQLVGTYLQKKTFAILLYPVASGNLQNYLDKLEISQSRDMLADLARFFFCLTHGLRYMHEQGIRHMDIKPSNILVHHREAMSFGGVRSILFTDFGISKTFTEEDGSQTAGPAALTKRWCSPEVAAQEPRGRAADVFSLGCVFATMYSVLVNAPLADFEGVREESGAGDAFHLAILQVHNWLDNLPSERTIINTWYSRRSMVELLKGMMARNPKGRPPASAVAHRLENDENAFEAWRRGKDMWRCCRESPESYRVAEEDEMNALAHE
ncbi:kinase-like protein [Lophiostoma macrostomum CBS 122681]|uniref:Kinase-like protein n=1 Tax=Lophiostoma macrostomum CBS 122681 TaxID=1314788 RepID=A0A6A6T6L3_9PLEO|nr:kinase-like protein [Lophiostoma macrostomum CBS 122681]